MSAPARKGPDLFDEAFMARLSHLELVARKIFASPGRGERRSKRRGAGLEFADHRGYAPGDDFRNIDWNVYARLGKLLLKIYEEEEDLWVYVLVDASASMAAGRGHKLDQALRLAAAIAWVTLSGLDRVAVGTFAEGLGERLAPSRGKPWIFQTFDRLRAVRPGGLTSFEASMKSFVHGHKRRGLVFVISDLYAQDGHERGLDVLRHHRFEPVVIQVTDPDELELSHRGDALLVDCETGDRRDVTLTPRLIARYREVHASWKGEIEAFCKARQIPWFEAPVTRPFEEIILGMLRRGGVLA